jgi:putative transposase
LPSVAARSTSAARRAPPPTVSTTPSPRAFSAAAGFATRQDGRTAVFDYIETFYNPIRLHSTLDYISPVEYDKRQKPRKAA